MSFPALMEKFKNLLDIAFRPAHFTFFILCSLIKGPKEFTVEVHALHNLHIKMPPRATCWGWPSVNGEGTVQGRQGKGADRQGEKPEATE